MRKSFINSANRSGVFSPFFLRACRIYSRGGILGPFAHEETLVKQMRVGGIICVELRNSSEYFPKKHHEFPCKSDFPIQYVLISVHENTIKLGVWIYRVLDGAVAELNLLFCCFTPLLFDFKRGVPIMSLRAKWLSAGRPALSA